MARNLLFKNQGMLSPYKKQLNTSSFKRGIAENPKSLSIRYEYSNAQENDQIQQPTNFDSLVSDIGSQTHNVNQQQYNTNAQTYIEIPLQQNLDQSHEETNLCQCQKCFKKQYPADMQTDKQYDNIYQSYTTFHNSPSKKEPCARKMNYQKLRQTSIKVIRGKSIDKVLQNKTNQRHPRRGAYKFTATYIKPTQKVKGNCLDQNIEEIEQNQPNQLQQQGIKHQQVPPVTALPLEYNYHTNKAEDLNAISQKLQPMKKMQKIDENDKFYQIRSQNLNSKLQEAKQILKKAKHYPQNYQYQNQQQQTYLINPEQQYWSQQQYNSNRNSVESAKTLKYQQPQVNSPYVPIEKEYHYDQRYPSGNYINQEQYSKDQFNNEIDEHTFEKIQEASSHIFSIGGEISKQAIQLKQGLSKTKAELENRLNNVNAVLHYFDQDISASHDY